MRLAHRMVKLFCESLNMSGQVDLPDSTVENNSGVRVAVRKTGGIGQPSGMVVGAATSFWLPVPCQIVFEFLTDPERRHQVPQASSRVFFLFYQNNSYFVS